MNNAVYQGESENPDGRPAGAKNKTTLQLRETITGFLENNFDDKFGSFFLSFHLPFHEGFLAGFIHDCLGFEKEEPSK